MRLVGWLSVTVLSLAVCSTAYAQECAEDPAACGRREFESGIEAYQAKDWAKAATHFEAAQKLRPHPVVLFNWALAESKLERYVAALAHFDQVLGDPETPKSLLPQIESERAIAQKNVATLEIEAAEGAETFVDDRKIDGNPPIASVDPGEHQVRVTIDGKTALDKRLRVRAGERLRIAVDRSREVVVPPVPPTVLPPRSPPPPPPATGPSPIWLYAGAGLTAVLGGVTVWSALDTKSAFDAYERDLPKSTQAEADARVASGHDKELRTNLLIGATALAAVGTAALGLFVVDFGGKQAQSRTGLFVGAGGIIAAGQF